MKPIEHILKAHPFDMGGIPIRQPLPSKKVEHLDPFLLLHHASSHADQDRPAKQQGVGPHPHRGFSPVTFVIEGDVHHQDSRGHNQVANKGDVQWMNAGFGIIHSERPSQILADANGVQEIVQLWINSPASKKMKPPSYQYLAQKDMQVIAEGGSQLRLVAGEYAEHIGKIKADSPLLILWGRSAAGDAQDVAIPENFNAMLYLIKGHLNIEGDKIDAEHLVVFKEGVSQVSIESIEASEYILFAGDPINEDIVKSGPFVMNTHTEILEAARDLQMGKMGILIEEP